MADIARPYWTYADLAQEFDLNHKRIREMMAAWKSEGFPAPLPWSHREKRWNPDAVRRWRERQERRNQSLGPPELRAAS